MVQESLPEAIKIAKTAELPGALPPGPLLGLCPWTPLGALKLAPGPHTMMASALLPACLESFQQ